MYTFALCIIVESALPYTVVAILTIVACGIKSSMRNALLPLLGQLQVCILYQLTPQTDTNGSGK